MRVSRAQMVYAGGMFETAFACLAGTETQLRQALLLAQSLRAFGGGWATSPMMALLPAHAAPDAAIAAELQNCDVRVVPYALHPKLSKVPLAARAAGAAQAEAAAEGFAGLLAWLDSDSLILREPSGLRIPEGARIGCRPVDLRLIGSPWEDEPDAFWESIYAGCGVSRNDLFPVTTTADGQVIRAYFNAGCLVLRPEAGLLRRWHEALLALADKDEFQALGERQRLFFHQAVLAGTLLASARRDEMAELPSTVNYPLHLHDRMPRERRPLTLRALESCRYESILEHDDWASRVPVDEDLRAWLEARRSLARGN